MNIHLELLFISAALYFPLACDPPGLYSEPTLVQEDVSCADSGTDDSSLLQTATSAQVRVFHDAEDVQRFDKSLRTHAGKKVKFSSPSQAPAEEDWFDHVKASVLEMLAYIGAPSQLVLQKAESIKAIASTSTPPHMANVKLSFSYCLLQEWWPLVMLFMSFVAMYCGLGLRVRFSDRAEGARSVALMVTFTNFMGYSIVNNISYDVSTMLGGDMTFSGCILGCFMCGSGVGFFSSWLLLQIYPEVWRSRIHAVLTAALSCGIVGQLGFSLICWLVPILGAENISLGHCRIIMLIARTMTGFGQGITALMVRVMFVRITAPEHRPTMAVRYTFVNNIALGTGPLAAAVALFGKSPGAPQQIGFQHVGIVALGYDIISLLCLRLFPDISKEPDRLQLQRDAKGDTSRSIAKMDDDSHSPRKQELSMLTKKRIVITSLLLVVLNSYVAPGLEAATSVILQTRFWWSTRSIGFGLSASGLCAIPINCAYFYAKELLTPRMWVMAIMVVGICSSFFCFQMRCFDSGWWILATGAILLPTMSLNSGLLIGNMDMYKFPDGTFCSVDSRMLLSGVFSNGVGRLSGPIVARFLYQTQGQNGYCIQQIGVLCFGLLLFITIFSRFGQSEAFLGEEKADERAGNGPMNRMEKAVANQGS